MLLAFDDFHFVSEHLFCPIDQLSRVAAIGKDGGDGVEPAEQPHQHGAGSDPVLDASRMHDHRQQVALRVYRNVPLAPLDLFARVVTPPPPFRAVFAD